MSEKSGIDWLDIGGDQKGSVGGSGGGEIFLRPSTEKPLKVRPLGRPTPLWTYYVKGADGKTRRAITSHSADKPENCIIRQKYQEDPKLRFVVNVLDRNDLDENGVAKLKVLEGPQTIFKALRAWAQATEESPGGPNGADFFIEKTCPDGNPLNTRYNVTAMKPTPISDAERAMIKERGGLHDLQNLFKITPQSEIVDKLYSTGGNAKSAAKSAGGSSSSNEIDDLSF